MQHCNFKQFFPSYSSNMQPFLIYLFIYFEKTFPQLIIWVWTKSMNQLTKLSQNISFHVK